MMCSFFAEIATEITDAAQVDGANSLTLFRRIALPLAVPGIVSFAIIDFIFVWNDVLLSLMAILPPMLLFAGLNRYYVRGCAPARPRVDQPCQTSCAS
jgi:ABC-type glycerol-3-phosphate transport system permease component